MYSSGQISQLLQSVGYFQQKQSMINRSASQDESGTSTYYLDSISACNRRKALLCGVSYRFRPYELEGTINDVKCMRFFLTRRLGFPPDSILMLTEDETDPSLIPTKQNIRGALQWLVRDCQSGDSLVFYFSGHGTQQPNYLGDEIDGYDENICPLDYETRGVITDDEINFTIVRPLPSGVTLHAIMDACHSGTVIDLPFLCKFDSSGQLEWENHEPSSGLYKGTSGGLAICFSSCADHQTSADTSIFSGTMTGAMTYCFLQAAERAHGLMTYGGLLNTMRSSIQEFLGNINSRGIFPTFFNIRAKTIAQEPQLSSSEVFYVHRKKFML